MCQMLADQNPKNYQYSTRSVRLNGQSTSIRLENLFWKVLKEMSSIENKSVSQFISILHLEVLETHNEIDNFTSLLRCACILHKEKQVPAFCSIRLPPRTLVS